MRDLDLLFLELKIAIHCDGKTQLAWFNSLELEEQEVINTWLKEVIGALGESFKWIYEQGMEAVKRFIEGLSPVLLEHIREMVEGDDAEDTG